MKPRLSKPWLSNETKLLIDITPTPWYSQPMIWRDHLRRAIAIVGSQDLLAHAMGCSQAKVSWLLISGKTVTAEDAVVIDRVTGGAVSKSDLRPDLWPSDRHPAPISESAQP